jgi:hypothetical protein
MKSKAKRDNLSHKLLAQHDQGGGQAQQCTCCPATEEGGRILPR